MRKAIRSRGASALAVGLAMAAATVVAGCGESGPKLVSVTGTVTHNGAPLADAVIMFTPTGEIGARRPGEDVTGPQGNFKLMTGGRSGVAPGKYSVVVTKTPKAASAGSADPAHQEDPFMANLSTAAAPTAKKKADKPLEDSYEREVTDEANQVLDFDVKSAATAEPSKAE